MLVTITESANLRFPDSVLEIADDPFFDFCQENPDYRIERDAKGRVVIMPGTGGRTGAWSSELNFQLRAYARLDRRGEVFDADTMFRLLNTAMRSPDAAWVSLERLRLLPEGQRERYLPVTPEFLIELRSPSDRLKDLEDKMEEWVANGCQLAWLIDPETRTVSIHMLGSVTRLENPALVRAEAVLPGFVLDLQPVWDLGW